METNAIAENNEHWIQEAEANNNIKINWAQNIEAEIVEVLPTKTLVREPRPERGSLLRAAETTWRVFWALWAMPKIQIQKAPGEYTHAEEYQNLQNQVGIQNHLRPY